MLQCLGTYLQHQPDVAVLMTRVAMLQLRKKFFSSNLHVQEKRNLLTFEKKEKNFSKFKKITLYSLLLSCAALFLSEGLMIIHLNNYKMRTSFYRLAWHCNSPRISLYLSPLTKDVSLLAKWIRKQMAPV